MPFPIWCFLWCPRTAADASPSEESLLELELLFELELEPEPEPELEEELELELEELLDPDLPFLESELLLLLIWRSSFTIVWGGTPSGRRGRRGRGASDGHGFCGLGDPRSPR